MKSRREFVQRLHRTIAFVILTPLFLHSSLQADAAGAVTGSWQGAIELPTGPVEILIDLEHQADGDWRGLIDIPLQGVDDYPLKQIVVEGEAIRFVIDKIPGDPTFEGRLHAERIEGQFTQGPGAMPFHLTRGKSVARGLPQQPRPPFPYDEEQVSYKNDRVELTGTLTLPPGDGPHPAVLLLSGSGPQDRDGTIFRHKPFWLIADHLTRAGIAVLRVDDRGVGGSGGQPMLSTTDDLAADALAGVRYLSTHPRVDAERIGLLGHSEGASVAPLAASRSRDINFLVLLAGPMMRGDAIIVRQLELDWLAQGFSEAKARKAADLQRELLSTLTSGANEKEVEAKLREVVKGQLEMTGTVRDDNAYDHIVRQNMPVLTSPWYRSFLTYDPAVALARVRVPVLALNGALDLQVEAEPNLSIIVRTLQEAGNQDVSARKLEDLNHLFQHAKTGAASEYVNIEETFAPDVLELITQWLHERVSRAVTKSMAVPENTVYYLEIITEDIQATANFYASAYGWQFDPEAPELGNALVATLPDGSLCGIRAPMHDQEKPIVRTYLRVNDLDAAVKQAAQSGATIAIESMEIPGRGKIAIFFLGGIEQGLWQLP